MAIKKPIPITFNLDSHQSVQSVCAVIHIDDNNTETLDLSLMQGGEHIAVSPNSTVTARFVRVKDKILISDNVPCAVQENSNIYIPIDNAAAKMLTGEIKIEVNITDDNDILTMQFPLVIRVNNTILADAEISPESEGTIPELLEEAREAAESATQAAEAATKAISTKQDKLTAGQNITISEGNVISAEGGGVTSYDDLTDKPQINGVTLSGNKRNSDLGFSNFYYGESNPPIYTSSAVDYQLNDIWINTITNTAFRLGYKSRKDLIWYPLRVKVFLNGGTPPEYENENVASLIYNAGDLWINRGIIGGVRPSYYSNGIYMCLGSQPQSTPPYNRYNISWVRLDTRIISAIVNANGTITFTDSEGNSFTTSGESVIGADGFSPVATVQQTASGATITVTDKNGTTTANISNGQDGNDYVLTAQDKTDIANIVLGELPTTEGVLYGNQSN